MNWPIFALALAWAFLKRIFQNVAKGLWDDLWKVIFEQVARVELELGRGVGPEKKRAVRAAIIDWIEASGEWITDRTGRTKYQSTKGFKLSFIQKLILNYLLDKILDALVSALNEELGNDWVAKAEQVRNELESMFPFLR